MYSVHYYVGCIISLIYSTSRTLKALFAHFIVALSFIAHLRTMLSDPGELQSIYSSLEFHCAYTLYMYLLAIAYLSTKGFCRQTASHQREGCSDRNNESGT